MYQERNPISIATIFPVGRKFLVYRKDGMSRDLGRWSAKVVALSLMGEEITLEISQDWQGADTRGEQFWTETKTIAFDDLIIPLLKEVNYE